jgi:Raf kinase inhibitor-like YbhB/YbcL family protein
VPSNPRRPAEAIYLASGRPIALTISTEMDMSSNRLVLACVVAALSPGCGSSENTAFSLDSNDLSGGSFTAAQTFNGFGCMGQNLSPELHWANPPAGTKSFVLTVFDVDAPTGSGFWHWTVFDIPPTTTSLSANAAAGSLPAGAVQGYTDFGRPGYGGPCPPDGDTPHHYVFKLIALNIDHLGLTASAPGALVSFAARGPTLATATFTATYGRGTPGTTTHPEPPTTAGFTLTSADVPANGTFGNEQLLNAFGCTGGNVSPRLAWSGAPAGTQSFVLTIYDPDAPTGSGFWHWLAFDIPVATTQLAKGAGAPGASLGGGVQGYNDTGATGYAGPCPPMGDPAHHYLFTLYAIPMASLATSQGLTAAAPGGLIGFVAHATATAKASFTAMYGR